MRKGIKIAAGLGIILVIIIAASDFIPTEIDYSDAQDIVKSVLDDGVITVSVEEIPNIPNESIPKKAISIAFNAWSKNNPDLNFEFVEDANAEIVIQWVTLEKPDHIGLATCGYKCKLEISLGAYDCTNRYIQADRDMVTNTIMHELGHALGLGHNINDDHLMFAEDGLTDANYNTLGFNIPQRLDNNYVGQTSLIKQYDVLDIQYNAKLSEFEAILNDFGLTIQEYENNPDDIRSNAFAIQINPVIQELNSIVVKIDSLGEKLSCYPNYEYTKLSQ